MTEPNPTDPTSEMLKSFWEHCYDLVLQIKPEYELFYAVGSLKLLHVLLDDPEQLPDSIQFSIQLMKAVMIFDFETHLLLILPIYVIIFLHACWRMKTERVPWLQAYIDVFLLKKE